MNEHDKKMIREIIHNLHNPLTWEGSNFDQIAFLESLLTCPEEPYYLDPASIDPRQQQVIGLIYDSIRKIAVKETKEWVIKHINTRDLITQNARIAITAEMMWLIREIESLEDV